MKRFLFAIIFCVMAASPVWAAPPMYGGGGGGGGGGGDVATDAIFDASGDLVQGTGADTAAKLTKGAEGTFLRAGAASVAWSTATFANTYAKGTFLYNAAANTVASLAHPGAANYLLYTNAADTAAWLASSANMISLLGSADYATARTNLSLVPGTNVQAYDAELAAVAGLTFADASIIQLTGAASAAVLTSGGNDYFLKSAADNSALMFATPSEARTALALVPGTNVQAYSATLGSLAGLTETNGGIPYGTADNAYAWLGAGATGKVMIAKGAAAPEWTPYTFPATVPTVGKVLISDGTNLIGSTALGTAAYAATGAFDAAGAAAGIIASSISDSDTTHCPDGNSVYDALAGKQASGSYAPANPLATDTLWDATGDLVQGSGANTAAKLTKGAEGTILRAGAASNAYSTSTFADTYVQSSILYAGTANTITGLAPTVEGTFLRAGADPFVPVWSTLILPNAGSAYYLPVFTAANTMGQLAASGTDGQVLTGVTGAVPAWSSDISIATMDLTSSTDVIPWPVATSAPGTFTTNGKVYYDSDSYQLVIRDQTNTRNLIFVPEGIATGGLIFGDSGPDAAGEIGYDGVIKYYDAVGEKTVATTADVAGVIAASISDSDTTHCPDGNSVYDALAGKQASGSYVGTADVIKLATFYWDGGGSEVVAEAASKRCVQIPFAATITGVYIKANESSTLTITPYKDAFATDALATTALISGAGTTGVTSTLGVNDTTLTGWTTAVSAGDEICALVSANDNALWISMQIYGHR